MERYRVTSFSGVPTIYAALLQVPSDGRDLSSLRFALCGAAPMPVELIRQFEARTGLKVIEGYGSPKVPAAPVATRVAASAGRVRSACACRTAR